MLGVRSVNRLIPVNINKRILKKKTKDFTIPLRCVNFNITKVITVTESARTVRNPVFIPKIKKSEERTSTGPFTDKSDKIIFSGEAKRGTLKIAFTKNITNKDKETVLIWFCNRGNLIRIARPKIIPWDKPMPKALKIVIIENKGSWKTSDKKGIKAKTKINAQRRILATRFHV